MSGFTVPDRFSELVVEESSLSSLDRDTTTLYNDLNDWTQGFERRSSIEPTQLDQYDRYATDSTSGYTLLQSPCGLTSDILPTWELDNWHSEEALTHGYVSAYETSLSEFDEQGPGRAADVPFDFTFEDLFSGSVTATDSSACSDKASSDNQAFQACPGAPLVPSGAKEPSMSVRNSVRNRTFDINEQGHSRTSNNAPKEIHNLPKSRTGSSFERHLR